MGRRMEAARPTLLSGHDPRRAAASFNRLALPRWTGSPVLNCPGPDDVAAGNGHG